jgi:hypothetical protein
MIAGLFAATAAGASALQNAGSIAAIVGAGVAVLLLFAAIVRWWLRHRRVWSVKPRIVRSGEAVYLEIPGLPASTDTVTAFVSDGMQPKGKFGPATYRPDIERILRFNLRQARPLLSESRRKYKVAIFVVSDLGEARRVFKGKVKTPW